MGYLKREGTMRGRGKATTKMSGQVRSRPADLGILALRLGAGGLLAGHGAQKLFGSFDGPGLTGTAGWLESMGLTPGKAWAGLAGVSELGGGVLTAIGLGGPLGPIALQGAMVTATRQAHRGKPIWNAAGGAELPVMFAASGAALALTGPGRFSLDRLLGLRVRPAVAGLVVAGVVAGIAAAESQTAKVRAAQSSAQESTVAATDTTATDGASIDAAVGTVEPGMNSELDGEPRDVLIGGTFVSAETATLGDVVPPVDEVIVVDDGDATADAAGRS